MKVTTADEFFDKLLAEQSDVESDLTDHRAAINAAFTACHLYEWIWVEIDNNWPLVTAAFPDSVESFRSIERFETWVREECPAIADMEAVAVGSKHLATTGSQIMLGTSAEDSHVEISTYRSEA